MKSTTIAKNVKNLFLADLLVRLMTFAVPIVVARYLGDERLGQYAFILSVSWIIGELAAFGFDQIVTREVAKKPHLRDRYMSNALALQGILSLGALIIAGVFVLTLVQNKVIAALIMLSVLAYFLRDYGQVFVSMFYVDGKMIYEAWARIVAAVIYVGAILIVMLGYGLVGVVLVHCIRYSSRFVTSFIFYLREYNLPRLQVDWTFWKGLLKEAVPLWFIATFSVLYFRMDTVALSLMAGDAPTGWYSAAFSIIDVLLFIPVSMVSIIFPLLAKWHHAKDARFEKLYARSFSYLFMVSVPVVVAGTMLSSQIIKLLYGNGFEQSAHVLQIFIFLTPLLFVSTLFSNMLTALGKQHWFAWISGIGVVVNMGLLVLLIPPYGVIGAASATLCTMLLTTCAYYWMAREIAGKLSLLSLVGRPIVAGLGMALVVYYLVAHVHYLLVLFTGCITYVIILFLVGAIAKKDVDLVLSVWKERKRKTVRS